MARKYYHCDECDRWMCYEDLITDKNGELCCPECQNPYVDEFAFVGTLNDTAYCLKPKIVTEPEHYEIPHLGKTSDALRAFKDMCNYNKPGGKENV